MIDAHDDFELMSEPELNILTYRYHPAWLQGRMAQLEESRQRQINEILDHVTQEMQKRQREAGKTFVSRTRLPSAGYRGQELTVFRVVLANPLSNEEILTAVLQEQLELAGNPEIQEMFAPVRDLLECLD